MNASAEIVNRDGNFLVMPGSKVDPTARLTGGSSISANCQISAGAMIESSIIESDCSIGSNAQISGSYISKGTKVKDGAKIASSFVANDEIIPIP